MNDALKGFCKKILWLAQVRRTVPSRDYPFVYYEYPADNREETDYAK